MDYTKLYRDNKENYLKLKNNNRGTSSPLIILTVPHSICLNVEERTCDRLAEKFADILHSKLINAKLESKIIKSSQSRYKIDDNRIQAPVYQTELWKELGPLVKSVNENVIILDIHSFPSTSFDNRDLVILANYPYDYFNFELSFFLGAPIKEGVRNAIIDFARSIEERAVLLEVNETLKDEKIDRYAEIITEFLKKEVEIK